MPRRLDERVSRWHADACRSLDDPCEPSRCQSEILCRLWISLFECVHNRRRAGQAPTIKRVGPSWIGTSKLNAKAANGVAVSNDYLRDITVLIADDQDFIRSLVREMLRVLGCWKIHDARDGETAWDLVKVKPIDMVITDWYMAPIDGLELTRLIRNDDASPNPYVPVIMISGFAEQPRIVEARDSGINEFVVKPLAPRALYNRIQNVIENPRQFVRTASFFGPDRRRKAEVVEDDRRGGPPPAQAAQ